MSGWSLTRSSRPAFNFLGRKPFFQLLANCSFPKWDAETSQVPKRLKHVTTSLTWQMQMDGAAWSGAEQISRLKGRLRHESNPHPLQNPKQQKNLFIKITVNCCAQTHPPQKTSASQTTNIHKYQWQEWTRENLHAFKITQAEESVWYAVCRRIGFLWC